MQYLESASASPGFVHIRSLGAHFGASFRATLAPDSAPLPTEPPMDLRRVSSRAEPKPIARVDPNIVPKRRGRLRSGRMHLRFAATASFGKIRAFWARS